MIIRNLIKQLHKLVAEFSKQTNALDVTFEENKKLAEWTIKYNIIKLQIVLTKKEKITCPISTLFCRIYLGKNEIFFFHIPEIVKYLEPENYKCYYFPYIESEERLKACFSVLSDFLKKHYKTINALAKSSEMSAQIKDEKLAEMIAIFTEKEPEPEQMEFMLEGYENYVLLIRYAGDGAYRQFICGKYENALKQYESIEKKGELTSYEKGLCEFVKERKEEYIALPEECNTILEVEKISAPSAEGKNVLRAGVICELVIGILCSIIVVIISGLLSLDTVYYAGMPWYFAFVFAGVPAVFGGITFRNGIGQKEKAFEKLINPQWVENMAKMIFVISLAGTLFVCFCTSFMSTRFYSDYMTYNEGEEFVPVGPTTCYYEDLKNVYYSEGVYNDYGDYIDRPSYLLEFEDGTVWDSDGFVSVQEVEEHILPIIESYYDEIENIEARNELIDDEMIDLSDYSFVNVEWTRNSETCTETLYFSADGDCSYYCACGNPVNDDDLCEGYVYDPKTQTIHFDFIETTNETITEITVMSYDDETLVLDFEGDIRTFKKANEGNEFDSEIVYNDKTYIYLEFNTDIFYYDLKESMDYEEDEIISIPHSKWDLIYYNGDLYIVDMQAEEAVEYYGSDDNYKWSVSIDTPEDVYAFPISVNSEDISYIYSMDVIENKTTVFFEDIELFASLIKTSEDGLISASTSLAYYENTWYWRSEMIDESIEGWPEYVVELNENLSRQISEWNATIKK